MRLADITPGLRVRVRRFAHRTLDNAGTVIAVAPGRKARVRLDDGKIVTVAVQRVQPMHTTPTPNAHGSG